MSDPAHKVAILSAPAGFGKSQLLRAIDNEARLRSLRVGRYSFKNGGRAPTSEKLARASRSHDLVLLDSADLAPVGMLKDILDSIEDGSFASRLVIATRSMNAVPIARLRATGCVTIARSANLRLNQSEVVDIFGRRAGSHISEIWEQAAGWQAATELLVQHVESRGQLGSRAERLIATGLGDYIECELLSHLSDDQRLAIILSGLVTSCTSEMLDKIAPESDLGRHLPDLADLLDGLIESSGDFYQLSAPLRLWASRAFDLLSATERSHALRNAAESCAAAGLVVEAVALLIRSGDRTRIADYVRRAGGVRLWVVAGYNVIRALADEAESVAAADASLTLLRCIVLQKEGKIAEAEELLERAVADLSDPVELRDAEVVRAALLVYGCRRITRADVDAFRQAMLRRDDDPAWKSLITTVQCILHAQQASFDAAVASAAQARLYAEAAGSDYNLVFLNIHLAVIALARGRLAEARILLSRARRRWRLNFADDTGIETVIGALAASLEFDAARLSAARNHLRKSAARMPHAEAWFDIYAAAYEPMARLIARDEGAGAALSSLQTARIALNAQGLDRVGDLLERISGCIIGEHWLKTGELLGEMPGTRSAVEIFSWQEREAGDLCEAYRQLIAGEIDKAETILEKLIDYCREHQLRRSELRAFLLRVEVHERQGDRHRADTRFSEAIAISIDTGQYQSLREFGGRGVSERIRKLDAAVKRERTSSKPVAKLLRAIGTGVATERGDLTTGHFTKREFDVLAALDEGGSDKVIGRRLGVSEHAVRYHLKNIFRKLQATDRVDALHRARTSGVFGEYPTGSGRYH